MAGAQQVFNAALGRTRSGSSFKGRSTRTSRISDGSTQLSSTGHPVNPSSPNMHLATTGPGSAPVFPRATAEARTFRPFAPRK